MSDDAVRSLFASADLSALTSRTISTVDALLRELEEVRINGYATNWGRARSARAPAVLPPLVCCTTATSHADLALPPVGRVLR